MMFLKPSLISPRANHRSQFSLRASWALSSSCSNCFILGYEKFEVRVNSSSLMGLSLSVFAFITV